MEESIIPIIIYEVRENYWYTDEDKSLIIDSESRALFQTLASAQVKLQELLNAQVEIRLQSAERYPKAFNNTPEAIAATAANKLHVTTRHLRIQPEVNEMPVFFIKELKVYY